MEEVKKLQIPEDYEVDRIENGEVILKKKKVVFPKTWEKCMELYPCFSCMFNSGNLDITIKSTVPDNLGNPMLALCQLLVCRNAWWRLLDYNPDWTRRGEPFKWCIHAEMENITVTSHSKFSRILAFPTYDIASMFLTAFRGLIEEAKELL